MRAINRDHKDSEKKKNKKNISHFSSCTTLNFDPVNTQVHLKKIKSPEVLKCEVSMPKCMLYLHPDLLPAHEVTSSF